MLARPFHGLPNSGDYLLIPGFNLCARLCHGKYSNVHEKLLFYNLHVALCYTTYDELENTEGKYSSEHTETYFTLFELLLAPKSNPLLAVEE